jgi:hypothetical protein
MQPSYLTGVAEVLHSAVRMYRDAILTGRRDATTEAVRFDDA